MPSNPYTPYPVGKKKRPLARKSSTLPAGPTGIVGMTGTPAKKKKSRAPLEGDTATRKERLLLDTFIYNCRTCHKENSHSSGYLFVVCFEADWLYFCDVNCCDAWDKTVPKHGPPAEPVTDRRGAIAATKAKNEEEDLRT